MLAVYAVSDGTGETAERVMRAALAQFNDAPVEIIRRGEVRSEEQVRAVVQEAAGRDSIILHTLVSHQLRHVILGESRMRGVDVLDVMGPVLDRLAVHLSLSPQEKPGLLEQLTEARSRQVEAVDFAFEHDDGHNVHELSRAEVVLVGVSRSMKTPTMLYMAYRGWFAANVPLIPEIPLVPELIALPAGRVFCLFTGAARLQELRRVRARQQNIPEDMYSSMEQIRKELLYAEHACARYQWQRIEATGKSVEEVCHEIITLLAK